MSQPQNITTNTKRGVFSHWIIGLRYLLRIHFLCSIREQETLTPSGTWSCPIWDFVCYIYLLYLYNWVYISNFLNYFLWLRITDEVSVPEMRIWSISLIESDLKWCIHLRRSLFINLFYCDHSLQNLLSFRTLSSENLSVFLSYLTR